MTTPSFFPNEASRMDLTADERERALAIKRAIEEDPELEACSDFWCAQLALVEGNSLDRALERARKIQHLREEYQIQERNYDYAKTIVSDFQRLLPENRLAFIYNEDHHCLVLVIDDSKFSYPIIRTSPQNVKVWMSGNYYLFHAMNPDFRAIRDGPSVLAEYSGFDWKANFGINELRKILTELGSYPVKYKEVKLFHTGYFANLLFSMAKHFFPREMREVWHPGCISPIGTLDNIYLQPTVEAANERYLKNVNEALRRRFENERTFSLSENTQA